MNEVNRFLRRVSKTHGFIVISIQTSLTVYRKLRLFMCFRYKNANLYRNGGVFEGFRYSNVRLCIEKGVFFEVFDTKSVIGTATGERAQIIDAKLKQPQNIDGGNSLDKVLSAVPKLVRSMRMPEKRNDRIR